MAHVGSDCVLSSSLAEVGLAACLLSRTGLEVAGLPICGTAFGVGGGYLRLGWFWVVSG